MTTVYDVPAEDLIERIAEELKNVEEVEPPEWSDFVKTGVHNELPPEEDDWWYKRTAAILRRVYVDGPVGVSRLRTVYGGKDRQGSTQEHHRKGSGSVIRTALQQLEDAGLIEKQGREGRRVTSEARSLLDNLATEIVDELSDEIPELERY